MAVRGGSGFRTEDFSLGGGPTINPFFFYDPELGLWVSSHIDLYPFGRTGAGIAPGFNLRSAGNVTLSATHGYITPHDGVIVFIAAHSTNTPAEREIHVYSNGSKVIGVGGFLWNAATKTKTFSVNTTTGNLSVEIVAVSPPNAPVNIDNPILTIGVRWRLP